MNVVHAIKQQTMRLKELVLNVLDQLQQTAPAALKGTTYIMEIIRACKTVQMDIMQILLH